MLNLNEHGAQLKKYGGGDDVYGWIHGERELLENRIFCAGIGEIDEKIICDCVGL